MNKLGSLMYFRSLYSKELLKEEELGVEHDELEKAETEIINHVMRNVIHTIKN